MIKNLLYSTLYFFAIILIGTILLTIFNYFNIFNINILKLILSLTAIFISSFILGKKSNKLGYIEGLKLGLIIIIISIIISLFSKTFSPKSLIYYLILLLTSIIGGMIGINYKQKNKI